MKAKDVSVSVADDGSGELYVFLTLKIPGQSLSKIDGQVQESSRKSKSKEVKNL